MKISIIGAGNVGSFTAMHVAAKALGDVVLVDIVKNMAKAKAFDMRDACSVERIEYSISGSDEYEVISGSDIVVITAGLARRPGMTREDLVLKNGSIVGDVCRQIKKYAGDSIVIVVTNPLDVMTTLALKNLGGDRQRVFGMGVTLDAARFRNLISEELKIPNQAIEAVVIGSHGEGMLPLGRLSTIKGVSLDEFLDEKRIEYLVNRTKERGKEIVGLLGSGSAYFAPALAITEVVETIVKDQKRVLGISAYLNGEYGIKGFCLGVPCVLGRKGIEKIIELDLNEKEKEEFRKSLPAMEKLLSGCLD